MSDHTPFIEAIAAAPDDDLPRLVYADWLNERGERGRELAIRNGLEDAREDEGWTSHISGEPRFEYYLPPFETQRCGSFTEGPPGSFWGEADGVSYLVSRGFVHTVSCTLDQWMGAECGECDGNGVYGTLTRPVVSHWDAHRGSLRVGRRCEACDGFGRGTGIGAMVTAMHPVQTVQIINRHPRWMPIGGGFELPGGVELQISCVWGLDFLIDLLDEAPDRYALLPLELFVRLRDGYLRDGVRNYHGEPLAFADLTAAAIEWAKNDARRP